MSVADLRGAKRASAPPPPAEPVKNIFLVKFMRVKTTERHWPLCSLQFLVLSVALLVNDQER